MAFKRFDEAARREVEQIEAQAEAVFRADAALIEALRAADLSERERALVQSTWSRRVALGLPASDPHRKWLHDIARRVGVPVP
jgi:hypothetical protein